jgi:hypothetical protein
MEYWALQFKLLQMLPNPEHLRSPGPLGINENKIVPGTAAEAVANLETVIRMYYRRHSFQACDTYMTNFVLMLVTLMMEAIKQRTGATSAAHLEHLRSTVLLSVKCLYDQGKNVHCSNIIYRLLRDGLEPSEMSVLRRYISPSEEAEKEPLDPQQARSHYPITVMRFDEDPEATLMENMVREYNRMALGSPPAAGESPGQGDDGGG